MRHKLLRSPGVEKSKRREVEKRRSRLLDCSTSQSFFPYLKKGEGPSLSLQPPKSSSLYADESRRNLDFMGSRRNRKRRVPCGVRRL